MSHWWISPTGQIVGPAPDSQDISYENNGYRGPFDSKAAAQAAESPGGSSGSNPPVAKDCAWFMVPPSIWQQILHGITHIGQPSFDIAVATYACGAKAATLRKAGYQAFASKAAAEASVNQANQNANQPASYLSGVSNFFHALTEKSTWIRVAEVLLGAALLLIGLAKLAGNTQVGKAAKGIATKAALI